MEANLTAPVPAPRYRMQPATRKHIATVYNRMAGHIEDASHSYAERFALDTVRRIDLRPGQSLLDLGCAAGYVALAAAPLAGPRGRVTGIDIAGELLALARESARRRGLENIEFIDRDMTDLGYPDAHFDAVASVFSVFFCDDMQGFIGEMWRMVKPGGVLAIRTWGPSAFDPLDMWMHQLAAAEMPSLAKKPGGRMAQVDTPRKLAALMHAAGIGDVRVVAQPSRHPLPRPEDWWSLAMGCGLRHLTDALAPAARERVRLQLLRLVLEQRANGIVADTVLAVARKP